MIMAFRHVLLEAKKKNTNDYELNNDEDQNEEENDYDLGEDETEDEPEETEPEEDSETDQPNNDNDYSLDDGTGELDPSTGDNDTDEPTGGEEPSPDGETGDEGEDDYSLDVNDDSDPRDADDGTGDEGEDDYSLDGDSDTDEEDDTDTDTDDGTDDMSSSDENSLKEKEKEIFGDLSDAQMGLKESELVGNFVELFDAINDILNKMQHIPSDPRNQEVINFIVKKLNETSDELYYYTRNTFSTKSYFQNLKQFNYYILIFKNIEKLFAEIDVKNKDLRKD